jgi:hypothetical protein
MSDGTRRRHRPTPERSRLEALELIARAAAAYRSNLPPLPSPLPCHTRGEWAERVGIPAARSATGGRLLTLMRAACGDCTIAYQAAQQRRGRCRPPIAAPTPAARLAARVYGADEPMRSRNRTDARPTGAGALAPEPQDSFVPGMPGRHVPRAAHAHRLGSVAG